MYINNIDFLCKYTKINNWGENVLTNQQMMIILALVNPQLGIERSERYV